MYAPLLEQRAKQAAHIIKQLGHRRMAGSYCATAHEAKEEVLRLIPDGATVLRCGSETVVGLRLWEAIAAKPGDSLGVDGCSRPGCRFGRH